MLKNLKKYIYVSHYWQMDQEEIHLLFKISTCRLKATDIYAMRNLTEDNV